MTKVDYQNKVIPISTQTNIIIMLCFSLFTVTFYMRKAF